MTTLGYATAATVVVVLVLSGASKVTPRGASAFRDSLPPQLPGRRILPYLVPLLELGTAAAVCMPPFRAAGFLVAAGLFAAFTAYLGWAAARDSQLMCACFGARAERVGGVHYVRNALLVMTSLLGLTLNPSLTGPTSAAATGVALGIGVGLLLAQLPWLVGRVFADGLA